MTRTGIAGLLAAAALVVVAPGPAAPAPTAAAAPTPTTDQVPWRWWDGAAYQLTHGLADPPGLNRDDCRPSARHPVPVILVHGTGLNGGNSWATLGAALAAEGYCVWAPTVGAPPGPGGEPGSVGGVDSLTGVSAPQLAAEIDRVRALTGAAEVDLVGHSQGAIIASYVTATARADAVRTVVTLGADPARSGDGPPEFVTDLLGVLSPDTARQDAEATLAWLGEDGVPFARGVRYVAVSSDYDELTGPVVAPEVPDFVDLDVVRLQDGCEVDRSGHLTVLASPRAVDLVIDALGGPRGPDGGEPTDPPPRCVPADQVLGVLAPVPPR
ncbi:esterase/lipase family protein [Dietzia maris]|uniref:esterase/lipase family protein n=1 Tax=Dietzia maris TaxID=37915 RepID=UPI00223AAC82|nr:alpha/beta fold hydrolase [Dietzia maris]MCT1433667.1 alpha/beta fold hydrolase [Dietzia maris]MCT1520918.1 alpha/beta fold hydrolase [Dietzia maris]